MEHLGLDPGPTKRNSYLPDHEKSCSKVSVICPTSEKRLLDLDRKRRDSLPETNVSAPENRPKPNRKGLYSNHPFVGAMAVSFREGKRLAKM